MLDRLKFQELGMKAHDIHNGLCLDTYRFDKCSDCSDEKECLLLFEKESKNVTISSSKKV